MNIRGLIFDKDGTIFKFQESWGKWCDSFLKELSDGDIEILNKTAASLGFSLTEKKFFSDSPFVAGTFENNINRLEPLVPNLTRQKIVETALRNTLDLEQVPVTNLINLFQTLKSQDYILGIATNDIIEPTISQLKRAGIYSFFDYIAGSDSGYGAKPEVGQLISFSKSTCLPDKNIAMIGDSIHDLVAGQEANMTSIGVLTGTASEKELSKYADWVIPDISKLPNLLSKINTSS